MWARAAMAILAAAAAAACGGCMAMEAYQPMPARTHQQAIDEFNEGVSLASELRYEDAWREFEPLADKFETAGDPEHAAEALFWAGYCNEKLGRNEKAAAEYQQLLQEYPGSRPAERAAERLKALTPP